MYLRSTASNFRPFFFQIQYKQSLLLHPLFIGQKDPIVFAPFRVVKGEGVTKSFVFLVPGSFFWKKFVISRYNTVDLGSMKNKPFNFMRFLFLNDLTLLYF